MKRFPSRVGLLARTAAVVALTAAVASCAFLSGGDNGGGGGGGLSATGADSTAALRADLESQTSLSSFEIDSIVDGAVGQITGGRQGTTEEVLGNLVAGAQRSLAQLNGLDDAARQALIETIVSSAVGSVGATENPSAVAGSGVGASSLAPRSRVVAAIARRSVESLADAGFSSPAAVETALIAPTRATVRALRRSGLRAAEVAATLDEVGHQSMTGLGRAGIDETRAVVAAELIAAGLAGALDDAQVPGLDISRDLPELVTGIARGAVTAAGATGIQSIDGSNPDSGVPAIARAAAFGATSSIATLRIGRADKAALERTLRDAVRGVTAEATAALADAQRAAGAAVGTIDLSAGVAGIVSGAGAAVDELAGEFGASVDVGAVVEEVAVGASEGVARLSLDDPALQALLEAAIDDAIAALQAEVVRLTAEVAALQARIDELLAAGRAAAANNPPRARLLVTSGGSETGPLTGDSAEFIEVDAGALVELSGALSTDIDDDQLEWIWVYESGPSSSVEFFGNPGLSAPVIPFAGFYESVYVSLSRPGDYLFRLIVGDGTDEDQVAFALRVPGSTVGAAPRAVAVARDAGNSVVDTIDLGEVLTLDGTATLDPDTDTAALDFAWAVEGAPPGAATILTDAATPTAGFTPTDPGEYAFSLTVDDGTAVDRAVVVVTVVVPSGTDTPPVASAGPDQVIDLGSQLTLDGSASTDADADLLTFTWSVTAVPQRSTIDDTDLSDIAAVQPTVTPDVEGTYRFTLAVTAGGVTRLDTVQVTVVDGTTPPDQRGDDPPFANAGPDRSVEVEQPFVLDGSASVDPDGDLLSFRWTLTSAPAGSARTNDDIGNRSAALTSFTPDVRGPYVFELTVTARTFSHSDTVIVSASFSRPATLAWSPTDDNTFALTWSYPQGGIDGYRIYEGLPDDSIEFQIVDPADTDVTSVELGYDGIPGRPVTYSVTAYDATGESAAATLTFEPIGSFVTRWKTDNSGASGPNQISLPLVANGSYDFTVDWGDGTSDTITSWNQAEATHTYAVADEYTVTIFGEIAGWAFDPDLDGIRGDALKLLEVLQWGSLAFGDTAGQLAGARNMVISAFDTPDLSQTTSLVAAFFENRALTTVPSMADWDVSTITSLDSTFEGALAFNTDIEAWDVSNVTNMTDTFRAASVFNQPLNAWDVSNVTTMAGMFDDARLFNQPLDRWDTRNVTNMSFMFSGLGLAGTQLGLFNQDISSWNIAKVESMNAMFQWNLAWSAANYAAALIAWEQQPVRPGVVLGDSFPSLDGYPEAFAAAQRLVDRRGWSISGIPPAPIENLAVAFTGPDTFELSWDYAGINVDGFRVYAGSIDATPEAVLPLSDSTITSAELGVTVPSGTALTYVITAYSAAGNRGQATINFTTRGDFVTRWKTDNAGISGTNQIALPLVPVGSYDFTVDWGDGNTDTISSWSDPARTHTYATPGEYTVRIFGDFEGWAFDPELDGTVGDAVKLLEVAQWGGMAFGDTQGQFAGATNLVISATDAPNLSQTTSLARAFYDNDALIVVPGMGTWNVSTISDMSEMFALAALFDTNIAGWNTFSVTDMTRMFYRAPNFDQPIGGWNMSGVRHADQMLAGDATTPHTFNQDIRVWNLAQMRSMVGFMEFNDSFSDDNYAAAISAWAGRARQPNVTLEIPTASLALFASAQTARQAIVDNSGWTIVDADGTFAP